MKAYGFADVVQLGKLTPSQVKWLAHRDVLRSEITPAGGTGHRRRFSFYNLVQARILADLMTWQIPLTVMQALLSLVDEHVVPGYRFRSKITSTHALTSVIAVIEMRPDGRAWLQTLELLPEWLKLGTFGASSLIVVRIGAIIRELELATQDYL
jgi:hypothetical protein